MRKSFAGLRTMSLSGVEVSHSSEGGASRSPGGPGRSKDPEQAESDMPPPPPPEGQRLLDPRLSQSMGHGADCGSSSPTASGRFVALQIKTAVRRSSSSIRRSVSFREDVSRDAGRRRVKEASAVAEAHLQGRRNSPFPNGSDGRATRGASPAGPTPLVEDVPLTEESSVLTGEGDGRSPLASPSGLFRHSVERLRIIKESELQVRDMTGWHEGKGLHKQRVF